MVLTRVFVTSYDRRGLIKQTVGVAETEEEVQALIKEARGLGNVGRETVKLGEPERIEVVVKPGARPPEDRPTTRTPEEQRRIEAKHASLLLKNIKEGKAFASKETIAKLKAKELTQKEFVEQRTIGQLMTDTTLTQYKTYEEIEKERGEIKQQLTEKSYPVFETALSTLEGPEREAERKKIGGVTYLSPEMTIKEDGKEFKAKKQLYVPVYGKGLTPYGKQQKELRAEYSKAFEKRLEEFPYEKLKFETPEEWKAAGYETKEVESGLMAGALLTKVGVEEEKAKKIVTTGKEWWDKAGDYWEKVKGKVVLGAEEKRYKQYERIGTAPIPKIIPDITIHKDTRVLPADASYWTKLKYTIPKMDFEMLTVQEFIKKGVKEFPQALPVVTAKAAFWDMPREGFAKLEPVWKVGKEVSLKAKGVYEKGLVDIEKWEEVKLGVTKPGTILGQLKGGLMVGRAVTGVSAGMFGYLEREPESVYTYTMAGAAFAELAGGLAIAKPALAPAIKWSAKGLGIAYGGAVTIEATLTSPEQRAELVGERLAPIVLLGIGGYGAMRGKLKEMAWEQKTYKTKYTGLSKYEAQQYKWIEEGKPVITTLGLKHKVLARQKFIEAAAKTRGREYVEPLLAKGRELWKFEEAAGFRGGIDIKGEVRKTDIDFAMIERLQPLTPTTFVPSAPLAMKSFAIQAGEMGSVLGGSLVPASIFKEEFRALQIKPHDIDKYGPNPIDLGQLAYTALGGKIIPKKIDIDVRPSLDVYKQEALKITEELGGRATGATAMRLQVPEWWRGLGDVDVEFPEEFMGIPLATMARPRIAKIYKTKLERKFGKGLFEIEMGRHEKVVWAKDVVVSGRLGKVEGIASITQPKKLISLVESGRKPVAELAEWELKGIKTKLPYVELKPDISGWTKQQLKETDISTLRFYYGKGKRALALEAKQIYERGGVSKEMDIRLGQIFGYTKAEIEAYVTTYKKGQTFIDIGKERVGYRVRTLKGLKVVDIRDLMKMDKAMIAKHLKVTEPTKAAKAKGDIIFGKKGLESLYRLGTLRLDVKGGASKLFTKELTEPKKWDKLMEIHTKKHMLYPNIMSVTPWWRLPQSYIYPTKEGIPVLSPFVQKERWIVGAFGEERFKDIPKFIAAGKGEIRLAEEVAGKSPFKKYRLTQLEKQKALVGELEKSRMMQFALAEKDVEKVAGAPITLAIGGKKIEAKIPGVGGLKAFEKRFGKPAVEELFKQEKVKGLGKRPVVEEILRKPKPSKKKDLYKTYSQYPKGVAIPYAPYKPYEAYPIPYKPYRPYEEYAPYKPYVSYKPYKPYKEYKPYKKYKPYKPYKKYKPYKPYKGYQPYTPYVPYKPYRPYEFYKPYEPPPEIPRVIIPLLGRKYEERKRKLELKWKRKYKGTPSLSVVLGGVGTPLTRQQIAGKETISPMLIRQMKRRI